MYSISLYAACKRGQLDRVELMLENGGVDNWRNPYDDVSCLQVVDNVVSVSVMEITFLRVIRY